MLMARIKYVITMLLPRLLLFFAFYFLLPVLTSVQLHAQNLVTNGNCDTYTTPPNTYGQVCYGTGWTSPSGTCSVIVGTGSPDYYNTNGSGGAKPPATFWSSLMPHSGSGMQGFAGYYTSSGSPYREYIQYHLSSPMVPGVLYQVSWFISNGSTTFHGYGCNHIGAYFSTTAVTQTGGSVMPYVPQVQDTAVLFSTTWVQKSFTFTPAAPYTYITIGNFYSNANTTVQQFVSPSTVVGAYYYVDDVVVQPAAVLPVEMLAFSGTSQGSVNHLSWVTATEWNNDFFALERSMDGAYFTEIGRIKGHGTTSDSYTYQFEDGDVTGTLNYYRLRQTDFNGSFRYSEIIAIRSSGRKTSRWAYLEGTGTLVIASVTPGQFELFNANGQVMMTGNLDGNAVRRIDVSWLGKGLYLLRYGGSGENTVRIIRP